MGFRFTLQEVQSIFKRPWFLLFFITFLCYFTSLNGAFHFDDSHSILENSAVHHLSEIPNFWVDARLSSFIPENRSYRPLLFSIFSLCWALGDGSTLPFHLAKVLMHFSVVWGLFLIWKKLWSYPGWFPKVSIPPASAAFILAALFAVHPACSECVNYISATSSLLCAMFYVWAFYFYLICREHGNHLGFSFLSLFLYFLSVASKEEGITLPAVVMMTECFFLRGEFKLKQRIFHLIKRGAPYIITGLVLSIWIYAMHPPEGNESRGYATSLEYFMTQWRVYLLYMKLWILPWGFNADNTSISFSKSIWDPWVLLSGFANVLIVLLAWICRKKYPALLFGVLWFYITISPASSVVVLAEAMNEHRMYLAYVGFVGALFTLLIGSGSKISKTSRKTLSGVFQGRFGDGIENGFFWGGVAIFIGLIAGTQERNRVWANDENLWNDTVIKNPTSGRALNNLALVYLSRGEYLKAIEYLKKCESYWSTYLYCPLNLGISYFAMATFDQSIQKTSSALEYFRLAQESLERAYQLNPRNVHTCFHLGRMYEERKEYSKAIELYSRAMQLTAGKHHLAQARIGSCLRKQKHFQEALKVVNDVLQVEPTNQVALDEKRQINLEYKMSKSYGGENVF